MRHWNRSQHAFGWNVLNNNQQIEYKFDDTKHKKRNAEEMIVK